MGNYYRYWGKAKGADESGPDFHLLPYHCLDVAAVACEWWGQSKVIREHFVAESNVSETETSAWVMFFIVLHDLGKFDVRFQLKAQNDALHLQPELIAEDGGLNADESLSHKYYHGNYAAYWVFQDLAQPFGWDDDFGGGVEKWDEWKPWIFAVAGHHGVVPKSVDGISPQADPHVFEHDKSARLAFIAEMEDLFLKPAGLTLEDSPPPVDQDFLAGYCSVCDWLGSMEINGHGEKRFHYIDQEISLKDYFTSKSDIAKQVLQESGLFHAVDTDGGMDALFAQYTPRLVQTLVDDLPVQSGLTIIEAPTGSGKTEAALAYASRLLAKGVAESIIFALPTQATANAMFDRLLEVTDKLYHNSNLLLVHGKARFNEQFMDLKNIARKRSPQDSKYETEATVQCSEWLSQSRKRVFLGQVGVCTIDQVLISVLPVKHKFVRSFGLGKSILIVDEVHAYDSYMYGLLQGVLERQKQMHGSAILLSATLPHYQKASLVSAWCGILEEQQKGEEPYPLITHLSQTVPVCFELSDHEQMILEQAARQVQIDVVEHPEMQFDDTLLDQVIQAANGGANVVLICNLVADAQYTAQRLRERGGTNVGIFHSRFRFVDRQSKEKAVMHDYGNGEQRKRGGILVATQVVEQSLDLDFDWMLTQLCPIDSLFQRLGRLHRHERIRPCGFELPQCSVVVPGDYEYGLHELIYGEKKAPNTCILWRTEQLLFQQQSLNFPAVYRSMIEQVYQAKAWKDEPENIQAAHEIFMQVQDGAKITARSLSKAETSFEDSDSRVALLTRDGEMSLNVIPVAGRGNQKTFLDGKRVSDIDEWALLEELSKNTIPVPASWKRKDLPEEKDGIIWLSMALDKDGCWKTEIADTVFVYDFEGGLKKLEGQ